MMSKFRKLLAISVLATLPVLSHASFSSKVMLPGGMISPNKDIEISFNQFLESVVYEVSCELTSNGKSNQDSNYIALHSSDYNLKLAINDMALNQYWQAKISAKESNRLTIKNATGASSIIIVNLDDTDSIIVKNCYALPQVS